MKRALRGSMPAARHLDGGEMPQRVQVHVGHVELGAQLVDDRREGLGVDRPAAIREGRDDEGVGHECHVSGASDFQAASPPGLEQRPAVGSDHDPAFTAAFGARFAPVRPRPVEGAPHSDPVVLHVGPAQRTELTPAGTGQDGQGQEPALRGCDPALPSGRPGRARRSALRGGGPGPLSGVSRHRVGADEDTEAPGARASLLNRPCTLGSSRWPGLWPLRGQ